MNDCSNVLACGFLRKNILTFLGSKLLQTDLQHSELHLSPVLLTGPFTFWDFHELLQTNPVVIVTIHQWWIKLFLSVCRSFRMISKIVLKTGYLVRPFPIIVSAWLHQPVFLMKPSCECVFSILSQHISDEVQKSAKEIIFEHRAYIIQKDLWLGEDGGERQRSPFRTEV